MCEKVDFLLLAGDLYDGDWRDYNTGHFFLRQMGLLRDAGIPVFMVWGNHDAENAMTKKLSPLENMNVFPSKKALMKERAALRVLTSSRMCFKPIPDLIQQLNRNLAGWANYFSFGYPLDAYRDLNHYTQQRLQIHLHRRSQRPYRAPQTISLYAHFRQLGLRYLSVLRRSGDLFT